MGKKRHNIGLLVANIMDPFSNEISKGAMRASEKADCNLFIVPGKYIDLKVDLNEIDAKYEYQYNALFSIASKNNLDFLIVCMGTIAYMCNYDRKKEILSMFDGTPVLSVSAKIDGYDYIQYENETGITQAVDYLVQKVGRKHICMMAGDLNNNECVERYEAYRKAVINNGLTYDEKNVMLSDINARCYREVKKLLDNNPECDAILCVNDDMALTVYDVLRERNIRIGKDISVVGFDDLEYVQKLEPPLASIRAEAEKLGELAIEKAVNYLEGIEDNRHLMPTTFIPRQSCFGSSFKANALDNAFVGTAEEIIKNLLDYIFDKPINEYAYENSHMAMRNFIYALQKLFIEGDVNDSEIEKLSEKINLYFINNNYIINSVSKLIEVTDSGYNFLKSKIDSKNLHYLRRVYEYLIRRITMEVVSSYKTIEDDSFQRRHLSNLAVRDTLMFDSDLKNGYSQILKKLHYIGIDTSYLYILKEPITYHNHEIFPTDVEWYFKSYQYGSKTFNVPQKKQKLTTQELFTVDELPSNRRFTVIFVDLYSNEKQYGIALCEPRSSDYFEYIELITYELSAAVKMIKLLIQQDVMLTELHTNNLTLETMSKIDELTGVFNRRGFYYVANDLVSKEENRDKTLIVCYADMDNLKYVNDNFGHIEGDFSIKSLADALKTIFKGCGIVGRVGGDEFAVVALSDEVGNIDEIRERKINYIKELNEKSEKPYVIDMSIGLYECVCDNSYDFKDAIDKADDLLYTAKKSRKKLRSDPNR